MSKQHQRSSYDVGVSELHPNPLLVGELLWFFTEAESAVRPPSNLDPAYTQTRSGRVAAQGVPSDDSIEDRVEAACAAGKIERLLRAMPRAEAVLLFAAFEPRVWPETLESTFKPQTTGIAVRLSMPAIAVAPRNLAELRRREEDAVAILERTYECGGAPALAPLKWRAEVAYVGALRAYAQVRGPGPSVVPEVGR